MHFCCVCCFCDIREFAIRKRVVRVKLTSHWAWKRRGLECICRDECSVLSVILNGWRQLGWLYKWYIHIQSAQVRMLIYKSHSLCNCLLIHHELGSNRAVSRPESPSVSPSVHQSVSEGKLRLSSKLLSHNLGVEIFKILLNLILPILIVFARAVIIKSKLGILSRAVLNS